MFCPECGKAIIDGASFCSFCGKQTDSYHTASQEEPDMLLTPKKTFDKETASTQKKKNNSKSVRRILIFFAIVFSIALCVFLADIFFVNSSGRLKKSLINTTWATSPSSWVTIDGDTETLIAYSVHFHSDGTATLKQYMATGQRNGQLDEQDLKVYKTETVDWEIDAMRNLTFDGDVYKWGESDDDSARWYFKKDHLNINYTYYDSDEFDYPED